MESYGNVLGCYREYTWIDLSKILPTSTIALMLLVQACGGGGSSSDTPPPNNNSGDTEAVDPIDINENK
jgi:hypothetical protein